MQDAVTVPVTVKHRIGVDNEDHYGFVRDFVGTLFEAGCRVFIVHARSAILSGLSPKENREVPPLRPEVVRQLKHDFPQAIVVATGGIVSTAQAVELLTAHAGLPAVDGVMLGRAAYHDPWVLHDIEEALALQASSARPRQRADVLPALQHYFDAQCARGVVARHMTRPVSWPARGPCLATRNLRGPPGPYGLVSAADDGPRCVARPARAPSKMLIAAPAARTRLIHASMRSVGLRPMMRTKASPT